MMSFSFRALFLFMMAMPLCGMSQSTYLRSISSEEVLKANKSVGEHPTGSQSLRIEQGNVWLNGNLIPAHDLPSGLQDISVEYRLQLSFQGGSELQVTLLGDDYLIRNGKISTLIPVEEEVQSIYYGNLRESSPVLFQRMSLEAELFEECMSLVLDYETADEARRQQLRMTIRKNLERQFDMNLENMELELQQLENEMQQIRMDIEFRKSKKNEIIEKRLRDLVD
jgi:hypothetical protein